MLSQKVFLIQHQKTMQYTMKMFAVQIVSVKRYFHVFPSMMFSFQTIGGDPVVEPKPLLTFLRDFLVKENSKDEDGWGPF